MEECGIIEFMSTLKMRFWEKVDKNGPVVVAELGECWVWTGNKRTGYGMIREDHDGKMRSAHRLSWAWDNDAEYPDRNVIIRHKCDNKPCIRPDHLESGSYWDNSQDASKRDRLPGTNLTNALVAEARVRAATGESLHEIVKDMPEGVEVHSLAGAVRGNTFPYALAEPVADPNMEKPILRKLSADDYRAILAELAKPVPPLGKDLAKKYGVHPSTITFIKQGRIRNARIIAQE
jgi:hypothetical protein